MDCKISVTTNCNARCKTCPVWECRGLDMSMTTFVEVWRIVMMDPRISRVLLNNTGDMYVHPRRETIWRIIESTSYKPVIMTTNAAAMDYVPRISQTIISFNGHDKASYEYTTGLPFDETREKIRSFYPDLESKTNAEIHCLAWGDTHVEDIEDRVRDLWADFPGKVRVSYKVENQMEKGVQGAPGSEGGRRIPCDYLHKVNIWPDGNIIQCAHDFGGTTSFGNILTSSVFQSMMNPDRLKKIAQHSAGEYTGICESCNYNTANAGRIVYVKE